MIQLKGVTKTFTTKDGQVSAVDNVSLSIPQGDIFGIIGFSGAGKSTLIRCINLLERPTQGGVSIDGKELTLLNNKQLRDERKSIGMIFQHFNLFRSRTVEQNVAYPLKDMRLSKPEIKQKVDELLEMVGLSDKAKTYPSQLSGGQKQRVAIARALATNPKVLLCDEATSALDPQTTKSILNLLKELNARLGITIVLITHEMAVIKEICNQVAVMERGKIVEQSDVVEVFSNPQQEITKSFIQTSSVFSKIDELLEMKSPIVAIGKDDKILKLKYGKSKVSEALLSTLTKKFGIDCNIIFANIEVIKEIPIGGLIVIVHGEKAKIEAALKYLNQKNIEVEVIKDGSVDQQISA